MDVAKKAINSFSKISVESWKKRNWDEAYHYYRNTKTVLCCYLLLCNCCLEPRCQIVSCEIH